MTGNELLELLKTLPAETLEQQMLFEVTTLVSPDNEIIGHVPIVAAEIVNSDRLLTPEGLVTPEHAMESYKELLKGVKAGEGTEEEIKEYMPFLCPKILSHNQLLFKLQGLKNYSEGPDSSNEDTGPAPISTDPAPLMKLTANWGGKGEA